MIWGVGGYISQPQPSVEAVRLICFEPYELVTAIAWSPDSRLLAVAAGNWLRIYQTDFDLSTGECTGANYELAHLNLRALTTALAFSPDGEKLAAGSRDGILRIWQVHSMVLGNSSLPGEEWLAHRLGVNTLDWASDSQRLATGGNDATAKIWDVETGKEKLRMIGGTFSVSAVAWTPGDKALAVANGGVVRLREPLEGRMLAVMRLDERVGEPSAIFALAIVNGDTNWQLAAGDISNHLHQWQISPDGRSFEYLGADMRHAGTAGRYTALLWDVAYVPHLDILVSAGGDGTVRFWSSVDGSGIATWSAGSIAVTSLAMRPDGNLIAVGALNGSVFLLGLP